MVPSPCRWQPRPSAISANFIALLQAGATLTLLRRKRKRGRRAPASVHERAAVRVASGLTDVLGIADYMDTPQAPDFEKRGGMVPVITQDADTNEVLM